MGAALAHADALADRGVRRHEPVGREALAAALRSARVMLYRGDPGETFCLSLAEAQAMGVPAVVTALGAVAERVIDGVSGRVAASDADFAEAAIAVLRNDVLLAPLASRGARPSTRIELGHGGRPLRASIE